MNLILAHMFWRSVFVISTALAFWLPMMAIIQQSYTFAVLSFVIGLMISYLTFDKVDNKDPSFA